jgi:hypothetical protein
MGFEALAAVGTDLLASGGADLAASAVADTAMTAGTDALIGSTLTGEGALGSYAAMDAGYAGVTAGSNALSGLPSLTSLGQGAQLGSSLYSIYQGNQLKSAGAAGDPFAQYRSGYAQQLQQLMANPSLVTSLPGYQFGMDQAQGALTKNLASQGLTGSGTAAQAITNQGQQYANQMYQQQLQTLSGLSGASINNAGVNLGAQASGMSLQNQGINNLVKAIPQLGNMMGGGS